MVDLALRKGGTRAVAAAHLGILGLAALVLIHPPFGAGAAPGPATLSAALGLLVGELGLPVLALALTAPAIQSWLAAEGNDGSRESYTLYAASNAGSLIGLLAYPFVVEPFLPLSLQWRAWRIGIWLFALAAALLWLARPHRMREPRLQTSSPTPSAAAQTGWIARAAIPAALLAAVTEYTTRDIAPVPLLWVLPLALYLGTWIVGFSARGRGLVQWAWRVQDLAVVVALVIFLYLPYLLIGPLLSLGALVIVGIAQHGALADSAPPPDQLGRFYVRLAIGGAAGTALVVAVGPTVLPVPLETPLALIAALALGRPRPATWTAAGRRRFLAFAVLALLVPFVALGGRQAVIATFSIAAGVAAMVWRGAPRRAALALLGLVALDAGVKLTAPEHLGGTHGVLGRFTVRRDGRGTMLVSGSTLHGFEMPSSAGERPQATLYYRREGPYGDVTAVFEERGAPWDFGVVGLGVGSLGCTAPPGTQVTYFEINPGVVRLARDTALFRSLTRCTPAARVLVGDARLTLAAGSDRFDLLTLDAFNSDAIPTHLLTREAFALYRERLNQGGVLAFHVSNRFLDLTPVVGALAGEQGWVAAEALPWIRPDSLPGASDPPVGVSLVAAAADGATLAPLIGTGRWRWVETPDPVAWTDDWTPLASTLRLDRRAIFGR